MCPRNSGRLFTDATNVGDPDGTGAVLGERWASSNVSPTKNSAGYLSGAVLNNRCPRSQNPAGRWVVSLI